MDTETTPVGSTAITAQNAHQREKSSNLSISLLEPDVQFWTEYEELWKNSFCRSPYQGPLFLQELSTICTEKVRAIKFNKKNSIVGAILLRDNGYSLSFLSDLKSDYNNIVFYKDLSKEDMLSCLEKLCHLVINQDLKLVLKKHLESISYHSILNEIVNHAPLFIRKVPYSICPILDCESPELLFKKMNRSKNVRYKRNRLLKMPDTHVEILTDESELESWCNSYCENHIKRWEDSPTPSKYVCTKERAVIMRYLKAWANDKTLVRFAIIQNGRRIALSAGLLSRDSFVGHLQSFDPEYKKHSLGNILINLIGKWLMDQGIRKINFGDGQDNYKYSFALDSVQMTNIYISNTKSYFFRTRAMLDATYRSNQNIRRVASIAKNRLKIRNVKLF